MTEEKKIDALKDEDVRVAIIAVMGEKFADQISDNNYKDIAKKLVRRHSEGSKRGEEMTDLSDQQKKILRLLASKFNSHDYLSRDEIEKSLGLKVKAANPDLSHLANITGLPLIAPGVGRIVEETPGKQICIDRPTQNWTNVQAPGYRLTSEGYDWVTKQSWYLDRSN